MHENVKFLGQGPFSIAAVQSASAKPLHDTVEMMLWAVVGDDPAPRPISVQMVHTVANKLGHDLVESALQIETGKS